jgi:hypothetical protein
MTRALRLARNPAADAGADACPTCRAIAAALAKLVPQIERPEVEQVDVCAALPGAERTVMRDCREGRIEGAAKIGRRWYVSRPALDRYLRARGPRVVPTPAEDEDGLEQTRRRLATPGRRRRTG